MNIYIASPYRGDTERNTEYAKKCARWVWKQGHTPVVPHLLFPQFVDETPENREQVLNAGLDLLAISDEVWYFTDFGISEGMKGELKVAKWYGTKTREVKLNDNGRKNC